MNFCCINAVQKFKVMEYDNFDVFISVRIMAHTDLYVHLWSTHTSISNDTLVIAIKQI
jgi:hypothetical protein